MAVLAESGSAIVSNSTRGSGRTIEIVRVGFCRPPSLAKVAQIHAQDLDAHFVRGTDCNTHSWSQHDDWTACCYTPDHAEAECMWLKPQELTDYTGYGFEIAYYSSARAEPGGALRSWQGSPSHDAVILNSGIWEDHPWRAIGIGIYGAYTCVWFGKEPEHSGS